MDIPYPLPNALVTPRLTPCSISQKYPKPINLKSDDASSKMPWYTKMLIESAGTFAVVGRNLGVVVGRRRWG